MRLNVILIIGFLLSGCANHSRLEISDQIRSYYIGDKQKLAAAKYLLDYLPLLYLLLFKLLHIELYMKF